MSLDRDVFVSHLEWMDEGTELFRSALSGFDSGQLLRPSLLEGWTVAHVISHVNSNARALVNLTVWASTGVETPMYSSNDQRASDIEAGAGKPLESLVSDFDSSADELSRSLLSLSPEQLDYMVKSAKGRDISTSEIAWMRVRELWVHSVDLGTGIAFSRFPTGLLRALIDEAVAGYASRGAVSGLVLFAGDTGRSWRIGSDGGDTVSGSEADLASWLLGRSDGGTLSVTGPLPELPPWL